MTPSVEQPTGHDVTMAPSSSVEQPPGHDVTMGPSSSVEQPPGHDVIMAPSPSKKKSVEQPPGHDVTLAPSPSKKKFWCGQERCSYFSDKKCNVKRHKENACKGIPREEIMEQKLQARTCPLCGQFLVVSKQVKKHQLTKYCKKNREKKQQGVPVEEYQYKYSE